MKFTPDFLASQSRKQLQTIAKKNGLKANASSADLIESLLLIIVDDECAAQDSLPDSDVIVEVFSGKAEEAPILDSETVHDCVERGLIVGARVEFLVGDDLKFGSIGKVNKKTYRITIDDTGSEIVLKHADVRIASMAIEEEKKTSSPMIITEGEEISYSSQMPSVEEAHPVVISEVLFFSADEFGSASKKHHSMGSATSTSFDSADIAIDSIQQSRRISLSRPTLSGKKSKTPVKSLTPPSHMPKYTKTQRVRREAALISAKVSRNSSFAPMPSIPNSSSMNKSTVERTNSTPAAVAPSPFRSTPSKSRNGVPDFQKMHQRMMNNSKPITDVVKRNDDVTVRMTTAMAEAHETTSCFPSAVIAKTSSGKTDSSVPFSKAKGTAAVKPIVSSETKSTPISVSKTVPFKARTMPNFKALHDRIPHKSSGTPLADKENSGTHCNKAPVPFRRQSLKDAKHSFGSKLSDRKESYAEGGKAKRTAAITAARMSGPFTSVA